MPLMYWLHLFATLYLLTATAQVGAVSPAASPARAPESVPMLVKITLPAHAAATTATGHGASAAASRVMYTQVFKPPGAGPFPILLYAHGRPAYASQRALLKRPIHARHVRYWLDKGYAVVAPIRPGYGITGGADVESSGVGYSSRGQCLRSPNPGNFAHNASAAQRQAFDWARQQPWARPNHIVLEGHSAGGLATVALCAANLSGVRGCINFSGGAGGDPLHAPGRMCGPEQISALMSGYGQTTRVPSIWLYAPNDLYWGQQPPLQWHAAFTAAAQAAGNRPSTFVSTAPIGSDGHSLQRAGSAQWGPPLGTWLKKHGL